MRALLVLSALMFAVPALAANKAPAAKPAANCPRTSPYLADQSGLYRGPGVAPRNLNQLPPTTAYMAVYRLIGGCEVPLTMSSYRNPRQR